MKSLEPPPLRILERLAIHPWLIVGVTCAGAFIGQLDASIVQLALPALVQGFNVKVDSVRWVAIAYLLAFACSLAVSGRVSEMMGRKLPYLLGFALFTLASLLCGRAETLEQLVALRALQGVGGGLLGANSMTILVSSVPADNRPHAIGWFTTAQAVGVSLGPIAGGAGSSGRRCRSACSPLRWAGWCCRARPTLRARATRLSTSRARCCWCRHLGSACWR